MGVLDIMIKENNKFLGLVKEGLSLDPILKPIGGVASAGIGAAGGIAGSAIGEGIELAGLSISTILGEALKIIQNAPLITLSGGAGVGGLGAFLAKEYKDALKTENKQIKMLKKYKDQQNRYKELLEEASEI